MTQAVYKIQNIVTNDIYIGSTVDFTYRKWCHIRDLKEGTHHSPILQNSWNKHGESAFAFFIIEEIECAEKLIEREQHYLDTLNPRYNICKVAGSPLGIKHTDKARRNMSLAHKGKRIKDMGHKEDCGCSVCDRKVGIKRSKETIDKLRNNKQCKAVYQYDLDNNFIKEWISVGEAARTLNISQSHISQCCQQARQTTGGYKWKWKELCQQELLSDLATEIVEKA